MNAARWEKTNRWRRQTHEAGETRYRTCRFGCFFKRGALTDSQPLVVIIGRICGSQSFGFRIFRRNKNMSIDRIVMAFAGFVILLGLTLSLALSPWWLLLTGFVGLNLLQSAFTGFCPLAIILKRFGAQPGAAF